MWPPHCGRRGLPPAHRRPRACGDYHTLPLGDPVFVGITAMSGPQIRYGLEFAARVRAERPGTPHRVGRRAPDAVARADGGRRARGRRRPWRRRARRRPLADALAAGAAARRRSPASRSRRRRRERVHPPRTPALVDLDAIPVELPYDLLALHLYPTLQAGRVHLQTSRGCPTAAASATTAPSTSAAGGARARSGSSTRWEFAARPLPGHEDPRSGRRQLLRRPASAPRPSARAFCSRGLKLRLARQLPLRLPGEVRRRVPGPGRTRRLHGAGLRRRERLGAHAGRRLQGGLAPTRSSRPSPTCAAGRRPSTPSSRG